MRYMQGHQLFLPGNFSTPGFAFCQKSHIWQAEVVECSGERVFYFEGEFTMSVEKAKKYLKEKGYLDRVIEPDVSTATVELAAAAIGVEPGRICKSLSFIIDDRPILILAEGMARVDNRKYKEEFGKKAKMIQRDQVEELIGHEAGGVCPFGVNENVEIYLDESLKKWDTVYPAAGNANSAVRLELDELEKLVNARKWVDVCK